MSKPAHLYRFDPGTGRALGVLVMDRPQEDYAHRTDLTADQPPDVPAGYEAMRVGGAWVLRQDAQAGPTLEQARDDKWRQMKAARCSAISAPLATPFGTFDADDEARQNIIHTAQLMQTQAQTLAPGAAPTVDFTLADNTVATLTAGQMVQVALLLAARIQGAHARGRAVRAAIQAATSAQDVAAITWSTP